MKISVTEDNLVLTILVFLVGCTMWYILPAFENKVSNVELGHVVIAAAPEDVQAEFNATYVANVPVTWSAPWVGSCYFTIDIRPKGAEKGEPETPEWDANHLIRAKYDGKWWIQKWINVVVLQQRSNQAELRFAIEDPQTREVDIYSELKCDDQLLDEAQITATIP